MKKAKNISLLMGMACYLIVVMWTVVRAVSLLVYNDAEFGLLMYLFNEILPALALLLSMALPVVLLVRNRRNKTGKVLPIVCAAVNAAVLLWMVFTLVTPAIPQFLLISQLGLIDTYFSILLRFLGNGGLFILIGCVSLIVGSILSFPKKETIK